VLSKMMLALKKNLWIILTCNNNLHQDRRTNEN
jgi:hypothetical protein